MNIRSAHQLLLRTVLNTAPSWVASSSYPLFCDCFHYALNVRNMTESSYDTIRNYYAAAGHFQDRSSCVEMYTWSRTCLSTGTTHSSGDCSRMSWTVICIDWMCPAAKSADVNRPSQLHLLCNFGEISSNSLRTYCIHSVFESLSVVTLTFYTLTPNLISTCEYKYICGQNLVKFRSLFFQI